MSKTTDIKGFTEKLAQMKDTVTTECGKAIADVCARVQKTAMEGMTNTTVDNSISYKHGHHPSVAGAYPAVDTGALRRSITFEVMENKNETRGIVGSNIGNLSSNSLYPAWLEYGTSRMQPRPWLRPSLEANRDYIKGCFSVAVKDTLQK